jgi:pimeloyl-ACP methyl ester carboxylesterase
MNMPFGTLRQVDAGVLSVGYVEAGPPDGSVVILLHGWPYDIHSFVEVAPLLAAAGYRVVVPYLRGYGMTRFLSSETFRNGQQSVIAVDIIALMDALRIEQAILAGFDWGARTANVVAALWPERCKAMVSVSGYLIGSPEANQRPLPPTAERQIHNYRWRLGLAAGEPDYDDLERRLAEGPVITVPTITLEGDANGAPHPDASAYAKKFSGNYAHRVVKGGIGHNLPQEAPQAFTDAVVDVDGD